MNNKIRVSFFLLLFVFNVSRSIAQSYPWAATSSNYSPLSGWEDGGDVCTDLAGNVFSGFDFDSQYLAIGSFTLSNPWGNSATSQRLCLVKYDPNGNVLWVRDVPASYGSCSANALATDVGGNVYFAGDLISISTASFGTDVLSPGGFLAKYDPNGNVIWGRNVGTGNVSVTSISTDASSVYAVGYFWGNNITIGTYTLSYTSGCSSIFVAKYDMSGNVIWAKAVPANCGSGYGNYGTAISADVLGNLFIGGYYSSTNLTVNTSTLTNPGGGFCGFIAKYDINGNPGWAKNLGGNAVSPKGDYGYGLSTDGNGNVYFTGAFESSSISAGTFTLNNTGKKDGFLIKYNSSGNAIWAKNISGNGDNVGYSVASHTNGVFLWGGWYDAVLSSYTMAVGSTTYSYNPLTMSDPSFIANIDINGNLICSDVLDCGGDERSGITCNPSGDVYFGSDYGCTTFVIGTTTLSGTSPENMYVAKFSCSLPLGENEFGSYTPIGLYPNPFVDELTFYSPKNLKYTIRVYNLVGEIIYYKEVDGEKTMIDLHNKPSGIYFAVIRENSDVVKVEKIIKQ
jgi:hypothetical protein